MPKNSARQKHKALYEKILFIFIRKRVDHDSSTAYGI